MARVVVVGGGPAGLMAAEVLAGAGQHVVVLEQMPSIGRKFLLAGRGGLNLTHSEDMDALLDRYGPARARLAPAIAAFTPADLRAWCAGLGEDPFVGSSGRVFPAGFRAAALLRAWKARLDALGVEIRVRSRWHGWSDSRDADAVVLALGGASWPSTGSDGHWVGAVTEAGVGVVPLRAANCGFVVPWSDAFVPRFAGQPLKNVAITFAGRAARGDAVVTDDGIEGGVVYALSAALRDAIDRTGEAVVHVDLRPDLDAVELEARVTRRRHKASTSTWLRGAGFSAAAIGLLREAGGHPLPDSPAAVAQLAKAAPLRLVAAQPIERAISTAGGVAFDEVDDSFMLTRLPGTFVAGEMLDWEAPTGGYLLQASFSTGVAAARGALAWMARPAGPAVRGSGDG